MSCNKCKEKKIQEIKLLDHGHIRLVDKMGSDLSIVRNARVSYDADWRAGEDEKGDANLINYLRRNGHNTPFEAVVFQFDIQAPIFVFRQWHRHRTQSYNELSARYRELPELYYIPEPHLIGRQNSDNKQMRDVLTKEEFRNLPQTEKDYVFNLLEEKRVRSKSAFEFYRNQIACGVPRELARGDLPTSTYSHMFATVNLHNLFGFLSERAHPHAQYEIRVYAEAIIKLIRPHVPVALAAFEKCIKDSKEKNEELKLLKAEVASLKKILEQHPEGSQL